MVKKAIALILAAVMVLALCGCGSNNSSYLTQQEREQIFYDVAREKGLYTLIVTAEEKLSTIPDDRKASTGEGYDKGPNPTGKDFISVEDLKLVRCDNGLVRPNVKVRCLYPKGELEKYPQNLDLYCNYINEDGEVIESLCLCFEHLAYDQVMWSKAEEFSHMNGEDRFAPQKVKKIQFSWYKMYTIEGGRCIWQNEWDFADPIEFVVSQLDYE